jgi:glutaredoxin
LDRFDGVETQVVGLSVDSEPCLKAWSESLGGITYPLLSDFYPHGQICQLYGVLRSEGYSERAIFVIDKQGVIRYVDIHNIDEQPDNEVLFKVLTEIEPAATSKVQSQAVKTAEPVMTAQEIKFDVVLYCTPWCPDCRKVRAYFQENGINFKEIDITRDRDAALRVRFWNNGMETTPTINIRGTIVNSFDQQKLDQLLKINKDQ